VVHLDVNGTFCLTDLNVLRRLLSLRLHPWRWGRAWIIRIRKNLFPSIQAGSYKGLVELVFGAGFA
jgi:hypothetical protein